MLARSKRPRHRPAGRRPGRLTRNRANSPPRIGNTNTVPICGAAAQLVPPICPPGGMAFHRV
eukprot:6099060-Pyramimonas_sp.AAC.1